MNDAYPPTITVAEAGHLLGLSRSSAYRAAARGELPTVRFGRRLVVPTHKVLALIGLEDNQTAPTPSTHWSIARADGFVRRDTA